MSLWADTFDNGHTTITAPTAGAIGTGAYTLACLYKPNFFAAGFLFTAYKPDNFSYHGVSFGGSTGILSYYGSLDLGDPNYANPPIWVWLAVTKGAPDGIPRLHMARYTDTGVITWMHADGDSTHFNRGAINRICIGDEFGSSFRGNLSNLSAFTREMADAEIEATFQRSSAGIMAEVPQFFVHFPASINLSDSFVDLAGGGVETIRSGVWQVSADPTNFDYSLGRSGKPKTYDGSSWSQHKAKVWNGTTWVDHKMAGHDGTDFVISK